MSRQENKKSLDELLSRAIGKEKQEFDFNKWKQNYQKQIKTFKSKTNPAMNQPNIWRTIMKTKLTKLVTAAVIIIAVLIGLNLIGLPIDGTSAAFAKVVEQIRNARTVTFIMEIQVAGQTMRMENWRKEPGLKRTVMPGGLVVINDVTQKKAILINPLQKQYTQKDLVPSEDNQDFF